MAIVPVELREAKIREYGLDAARLQPEKGPPLPELPDITVYVEHLERRLISQQLERIRIKSPFLLRSVQPDIGAAQARSVERVMRLGKRIVIGLDGDLYLILHLMIAGRLRWKDRGAAVPGKHGLAAFDFSNGTLILTEAGSKKRASLYLVQGTTDLRRHDPGGLEVLTADLAAFRDALLGENRTLKRAITDPRIISGIGNAYSDEILHQAGLSPLKRTGQLSGKEVERLFGAVRETLESWIERLRSEAGDSFPDRVTAFHDEMAVHGRYGQPCPACGTSVQRIRYAENESNYCPACQTEGRLLKDRAFSRILKEDWPKTLEELELRLGNPSRQGDY